MFLPMRAPLGYAKSVREAVMTLSLVNPGGLNPGNINPGICSIPNQKEEGALHQSTRGRVGKLYIGRGGCCVAGIKQPFGQENGLWPQKKV